MSYHIRIKGKAQPVKVIQPGYNKAVANLYSVPPKRKVVKVPVPA